MTEVDSACGVCSEPIDNDEQFCSWCKITDDEAHIAAAGNPLRLLEHLGMLDGYYKSVEAIERGKPKRQK